VWALGAGVGGMRIRCGARIFTPSTCGVCQDNYFPGTRIFSRA